MIQRRGHTNRTPYIPRTIFRGHIQKSPHTKRRDIIDTLERKHHAEKTPPIRDATHTEDTRERQTHILRFTLMKPITKGEDKENEREKEKGGNSMRPTSKSSLNHPYCTHDTTGTNPPTYCHCCLLI